MELIAVLIKIVGLISDACRNVDKLPAALITGGIVQEMCIRDRITGGIVQAAAALALAIFESPAGIFIGHGKAPLYLYYSILIAANTVVS
ncbi:hypothetical protein BAE44_0023779 [Dichanthelium oligosanthes]|uniref:Uncharacterized protein n=1 Tax=Dichanthelium oligosanthes TaxID=888268 RepID=A0A1E5UQM6_9POAL|nr:hypothetical protein BAE44_0023779 [Dichanthelium oligosanthes]